MSNTSTSVRPPDLANVLREVNRLRAERALPPLVAMPEGEPYYSRRCSLALALEAQTWKGGTTYIPLPLPCADSDVHRLDAVAIPLSPLLCAFVKAFDGYDYPELLLADGAL